MSIWGGKGRGFSGALALCAALLALAVLVPGSALAATGSISGTVTDVVTDDPIEGVEICAWQLPDEDDFGCAESAADGTYTISGLEAGEYGVEFWAPFLGYRTQFYDGKEEWLDADPVTVGAVAATEIDAAMQPGGRIEGTVTTAVGGKPVNEVEVCAWRVNGEEGEELARCFFTGFDGTYELVGLETGEYKVEFWTGATEANLATQFYDHKYVWSDADVLAVTEGETESGIDAALDPGGEISGTVVADANGQPVDETVVCSIEATTGLLWSCTETGFNGGYALTGLPPGGFKVGFSVELREFFGEEVEVGENDGYLTQFYNDKPTLAAAEALSLPVGGAFAGIDARLDSSAPLPKPPVAVPPVAPRPPLTVTAKKPKRCKAGFRRKKVRGKVRCVKVKWHKRKHHRGRVVTTVGAPSPELRHLFDR
ncbi:MAG TPA: carboxypeptidase-like regulatory domain-containing protein [Solirubrobacterales bacterium]|nr:carboxypeptidase-like regulatory domain-containing protein [Solirubrobacterales bacterium]